MQAHDWEPAAPLDRRAVAIHEAGHALFTLSQGGVVEWLTCDSWTRDESGRRYRMMNEPGEPLTGICFYSLPAPLRDRPESRLAGLLAGIEAEAVTTDEAANIAEAFAALDLAIEWLPDEGEAHAACRWVSEWLGELCRHNAALLECLAAALLEEGEMDGAAVAAVVDRAGGVAPCSLPSWQDVRAAALAAYGGELFIELV